MIITSQRSDTFANKFTSNSTHYSPSCTSIKTRKKNFKCLRRSFRFKGRTSFMSHHLKPASPRHQTTLDAENAFETASESDSKPWSDPHLRLWFSRMFARGSIPWLISRLSSILFKNSIFFFSPFTGFDFRHVIFARECCQNVFYRAFQPQERNKLCTWKLSVYTGR